MSKKVRDYYSTITSKVELVNMDTPINEVIMAVSRHPASRSAYVVDNDGKLLGVITVRDVLNIIGAKYLDKRTATAIKRIMAVTAADLMREAESVNPDDTMERALKIAVMHNMGDIPVVEQGKVVGNLDCFELLNGILDQHKLT
jgi:CBS domain-containing protein